jgi:hypothetical protein
MYISFQERSRLSQKVSYNLGQQPYVDEIFKTHAKARIDASKCHALWISGNLA